MISPSQSYHLACGSPAVDGATDLPAGSVCAACGYPARRGMLMRKWPGADSLVLDKLRAPASPYACDGCVWSCTWAAPPGRSAKEGQGRGPSPPMYSHLLILDDAGRVATYANASKGEKPTIRSWLTSPKPGPWWLVVADMGKKQLIPWAEWNLSTSTRNGAVFLDDEPVSVGDLAVIEAMAHVLTVGATKATVETGDYTPNEWARCADDLRAFEAAWGRLRGGAWFRLALWLAQRDEDAVATRLEEEKAAREDIEAGLESGQVQIHGSKTLKSRQPVPVLSIFRGLLERSLRLARPDGVAFGVWVLSGNARREILTACRRAEIAPATWNDLRRTHGRWLRRAGVSVELIGEQLRHTSPAMARRVYATIAPDELGAQIEAVLCPPTVRLSGDLRVTEGF